MNVMLGLSWLISNRTSVIRVLSLFYWLNVLLWLGAAWLMIEDFAGSLPMVYGLGRQLGMASLVLYILTLLPGIITRLSVLPDLTRPVASLLTPFRRQLGVNMFLLALGHQFFVQFFPFLFHPQLSPQDIVLTPHTLVGVLALVVLMPLWLTSNDRAVRYLGRWWKRVHRLTYVAMLLIFAHVALFNSWWAVVMGVVVILEAASWVRWWARMNASR
jgi:methionine sulfoxide reductase heme-binding subunit